MKFAKELEDDLVAEWREKYFDYKLGKKKIKAVTRAVRNAQKSPSSTRIRPISRSVSDSSKTPILGSANGYGSFWTPQWAPPRNGSSSEEEDGDDSNGLPAVQSYSQNSAPILNQPQPPHKGTQPIQANQGPKTSAEGEDQRWTRYGSIVGSPPSPLVSGNASLRLPGPAMDPDAQGSGVLKQTADGTHRASVPRMRPSRRSAPAETPQLTQPPSDGGAFEVGKTKHPFRHVSFSARHLSLGQRSKSVQNVNAARERPLLKRIFSPKPRTQNTTDDDVPLEALKEIDVKQAQFFDFLDKELDKIETFYKSKEEEATHRLQILRDQLHVMRDQRLEEIVEAQRRKEYRKSRGHHTLEGVEELNRAREDILANPAHFNDLPHGLDVVYHPIQAARQINFRRQPRHPNNLATPPTSAIEHDHNADYQRRPEHPEVPYLTAKRKLKAAIQEYYRGLELLKAYALLNRTAFRKINKKYDKAVRARPTMRYMSDKVNKAQFVQSTVLDGHITAVEDLYARYFEKGNHKVAVNKLRKKNAKVGSYTGSVFRNGFLAAAGLVFGIEGIVYGADLLFRDDAVLSTNTSYLLQLYGGYFLLLYLLLFFCFDAMIFTEAKVNYVFIFEFDTRHNLDWRQLFEIPSFCLFLLGFIMWLNFTRIGGDTMYLYYPVILIGLTFILLFAPVPYVYHQSRRWFLYACWRLLFAGAYPVEFRDFFLGDMFCSQTYALGNVELFFCLYAHNWNDPPQCNSSHSRLLGFFTAVPGIWRALQCMRRYYDTRNVFPHLVNCGKYAFTILAAVSLSTYRIDKTQGLRAFFITVSTINSVYTSIWDLLMDWSLLDPRAPHAYLRTNLAYKWAWAYYAAMVIDPILRFNWIFYAIFAHDVQHSAVLSFFVALSEVTRRGIWVIFRVENEHCTNVARYRASRDVPLPYKLPTESTDAIADPEIDAAEAESRRDQEANINAIAAAGGLPPTTPALSANTGAESATPLSSAGLGVSSSYDLERGQTRTQPPSSTSATSPAISSLRRRQTTTGARSPTVPHTPSIRERFGTILRGAHAQDFERRRKEDDDDDAPLARGASGRSADDDDDDEEDKHEHEMDMETGGHGMDTEDTEEVGRRLGSPVSNRGGRGTLGGRWREIAGAVSDARVARVGVAGGGGGGGASGEGYSDYRDREGSGQQEQSGERDEDDGADTEEDEDGDGEELSPMESYNSPADRRDMLGAQILTRAARGQ